jgi:hypothetical protein
MMKSKILSQQLATQIEILRSLAQREDEDVSIKPDDTLNFKQVENTAQQSGFWQLVLSALKLFGIFLHNR